MQLKFLSNKVTLHFFQNLKEWIPAAAPALTKSVYHHSLLALNFTTKLTSLLTIFLKFFRVETPLQRRNLKETA